MAYTNSPMVAYTRLSPNHSGQPSLIVRRYGMKSKKQWRRIGNKKIRKIKTPYPDNSSFKKAIAKDDWFKSLD